MRIFGILLLFQIALAGQPFLDRTHLSRVLGEPRHYRIFLPADYETSGKHYPAIYYFHGSADRYTLEKYDNGTDTVPKIADYVAHHDVIVVSVDGYVARDYPGFYGGSPWDITLAGGEYDFGRYFLELTGHIDATYRTLTDRRHRATSGLSMGGFMSLWLSARYPDWIGSASSFNPGPEFYAGDKGSRVLWRPKDHVSSHTLAMIRLIRASGDYISQYHEETRDAYARAEDVDFEFRQDEYHRHWATSIAETFDFHLRAFANSALDNVPVVWNHSDPYHTFDVWGYHVTCEGDAPAIAYLEDVSQGGLRVSTRAWAPDGPAVPGRKIAITTAMLYKPGVAYKMLDYNLATGLTSAASATADSQGRITIHTDGAGHQISFAGPGAGAQPPVLLPLTVRDKLRVEPGKDVTLPIRIYNPRGDVVTGVKVGLTSKYPTVRILGGSAEIGKIESGGVAAAPLGVRFTAGAGYFARTRLQLTIGYDGAQQRVSEDIDVLVTPEVIPELLAFEILDGRTATLDVFRQKGNQGGGASIPRTVTEGRGNGNGILEPGEEATIWVKLRQGLDPFDKGNWYRTKIYTDSKYVTEIADLEEQKQLEWTGAKERTSVIRLAPDTPAGTTIPLLLDNESWSYSFTPDVRYGKEELYQAYEFHAHHLHRLELKTGMPIRP